MRRSKSTGSTNNKKLAEVCLIKKKEYPEDPKDLENLAANLYKFDIYHIFEIGNSGTTIKEKAKTKSPPPLSKPRSVVVTPQPHQQRQKYIGNQSSIAEGVIRPTHGKSYDYKKFMTKNNQYKCPFDICGKLFGKATYLREHLFTHDEEKPYKCDGCRKGFAMNKYRMRHSREHCQSSKFFAGQRKLNNSQHKHKAVNNQSKITENSMVDDNDDGGCDDGNNQTIGSLWDNSDNIQDLLAQQQSYYQEMNEDVDDSNENGDDDVADNDATTNLEDDEQNGNLTMESDDIEPSFEFLNPFDFL